MLKNKNNFVPIRSLFYQAELSWHAPSDVGFDATVDAIIAVRKANPRFNLATDRETVEIELENSMTAQLQGIPGGDAYLINNAPIPPPGSFLPAPRRARSLGAVVVGSAHKVKAGVGLLMDFLGPSLKAVPHELAEKRAGVCVACPNNKAGRVLTDAFGEGLRLLLEARSDMQLSTSFDPHLKTCSACECKLHLKPHVELKYILEKLTPEQREKLWGECWIAKEEKSLDAA